MFVLATVVQRSAARLMEWSSLQDLHLPLLLARAKQHRSAEQVTAIPLVQTKLANPRLKARQFAA